MTFKHIYTGSQDRTVKVFNAEDGKLCRTLEGHAHWVCSLTVSLFFALWLWHLPGTDGQALAGGTAKKDNVHRVEAHATKNRDFRIVAGKT